MLIVISRRRTMDDDRPREAVDDAEVRVVPYLLTLVSYSDVEKGI